MSDILKVDARGLSCPQPALMTREALQKVKKGTVEVQIDTTTALENITRIAKNLKWEVIVENTPEGDYQVTLKK